MIYGYVRVADASRRRRRSVSMFCCPASLGVGTASARIEVERRPPVVCSTLKAAFRSSMPFHALSLSGRPNRCDPTERRSAAQAG